MASRGKSSAGAAGNADPSESSSTSPPDTRPKGTRSSPQPLTFDQISQKLELQDQKSKQQITVIDSQLLELRAILRSSDPETRDYKKTQRKAGRLVHFKRLHKRRLDNIEQQMLNLEKMKLAAENMKENATQVKAVRQAREALREQIGGGVDEVHELQHDFEDMISDERIYGLPELDSEQLSSELNDLDTLDLEESDDESVPDYLLNAVEPPTHQLRQAEQVEKKSAYPSLKRSLA
eukprot:175566_1